MNCLRCRRLKVGGQLHDELYCTAARPPARLALEDLNIGECPHGVRPQHRWSAAEKMWLRLNYRRRGPRACAEFLGRSVHGVRGQAQTLGLSRPARVWRAEMDAYLRGHYEDGSRQRRRELAAALGVSIHAVAARAQLLGIKRRKQPRWSADEIAYVRRYACRLSLTEIARRLGRTRNAVEIIMGRRGIHVRQHWSLRDVMALFGSGHHRLITAAIHAGNMPGVRRLDDVGRTLWQIKADDVARFALGRAQLPRGSRRGGYHWLSIERYHLERLIAEANGARRDLARLRDRLNRVLRIRCRSHTLNFRTYVGMALRRAGYDAWVPAERDYLLTDAPAAALDRIFTSRLRARMQVARAWPRTVDGGE